jgi:carbamoyl-phosphate synthase small subunit
VVEGLTCLDLPAFSVQYHPEAAAGPHDAAYLFDRFVGLMTNPAAWPPAIKSHNTEENH